MYPRVCIALDICDKLNNDNFRYIIDKVSGKFLHHPLRPLAHRGQFRGKKGELRAQDVGWRPKTKADKTQRRISE
jgi:hypothetical protein